MLANWDLEKKKIEGKNWKIRDVRSGKGKPVARIKIAKTTPRFERLGNARGDQQKLFVAGTPRQKRWPRSRKAILMRIIASTRA